MWKQVVLLAVMFTSVVGLAGTVSDIESRSSWRCKHDEGTRGSSEAITALVDGPSRDGQARRFDVSWSANGGERCSTPLGVLDTTSTYFTYDVWWYITDLSHVNNLEFDLNQVLPNRETIIYGTQCSFRLGRWKYTTREGGKARWNTSNPTCSRREWTANSWHHLVLQFHRDETGVVTYDSVSFDGNVQAFNDASGPSNFALRWYPPGLQVVNFQIGGDDSSHDTTAYLDSFSVTGSAEPVSSRLTGSGSLRATFDSLRLINLVRGKWPSSARLGRWETCPYASTGKRKAAMFYRGLSTLPTGGTPVLHFLGG